jgi:hypothetical protein
LDIDVRDRHNGFDTLKKLGVDPSSGLVASTPSKGLHLFYKYIPSGKFDIAPGLEFRGDRSYVVVPPCKGRAWLAEGDASVAPEWLMERIRQRTSHPSTHPDGVLRAHVALTNIITNAAQVLSQLDPENYKDFGAWIKLMMACYAAGIDRETFVDWSTGDPDYANDADEIRYMWDRLNPREVTAATLFAELRKGGPAVLPPVVEGRREMTNDDGRNINSIARCVGRSKADEELLFWAACRYGEIRMEVWVSDGMLEQMLMSAAWECGLRDEARVRRQIRNGLRIGSQAWLKQREGEQNDAQSLETSGPTKPNAGSETIP